MTSYLLLGLFTDEVTFFKSVYDEKTLLNWHEIGYASLIAILLAIIASYLHTYGIATWLFRKIGASYRIADEDIWELFHNSRKTGHWLFIRDHKIHVIYFGYIKFYSDSEKDRELVIENVSVFDENSNLLYKCPVLYISRNKFDLTIELFDQPET